MQTARKLLNLVLEFDHLTPGFAKGLNTIENNPPRLIRHQRIQALLHALDINADFKSFVDGSFVLQRDLEDYNPVVEEIVHISGSCRRFQFKHEITIVFKELLAFRRKIYACEKNWGGIIESGRVLGNLITLTEPTIDALRISAEPVDRVLALIIDPKLKELDDELLVKEYGYLDVDLATVDAEWT